MSFLARSLAHCRILPRTVAVVGVAAAAVLVGPVASSQAAVASQTDLPTAQINGVVWSQVVVGHTVYATGSFTAARPPGASLGTNESPRSNLVAYDLITGALSQTWAPSLNAQGTAITASADGTKIFVGGDFTTVNGGAAYRIAALDATTGQTLPFKAKASARVRALTVYNGVLYAGGTFSDVGGVFRNHAAAFSVSDGTLLAWAPNIDMTVKAILATPRGAGAQVVLGGWFTSVNGQGAAGTASVNAVSGANNSWPMNAWVTNSGQSGVTISSLSTDGSRVYASGENFVAYKPGWLEGTAAADLNGNLAWVAGCHGDTHSVYQTGGVSYAVGHAHDCSFIGGFAQTSSPHRLMGFYTPVVPGKVNVGGDFPNFAAPQIVDSFVPYVSMGTYTGQNQGGWNVTGDAAGHYLVMGGEFTVVGGHQQQGLARFPIG